jgi:hypothetical protein
MTLIRGAFLLVLFATTASAQSSLVFENEYVRVSRGTEPCSVVADAKCTRIVVASGDVTIRFAAEKKMKRSDVEVLLGGTAYTAPAGSEGLFYQVTLKPKRPKAGTPGERIRAKGNREIFENDSLLIFEEHLKPGEIRERHSHSQRVVIQLNRTKLRQWPDGEAELLRDIEPDRPSFNQPVIHRVENVGTLALRGIVIELKR